MVLIPLYSYPLADRSGAKLVDALNAFGSVICTSDGGVIRFPILSSKSVEIHPLSSVTVIS